MRPSIGHARALLLLACGALQACGFGGGGAGADIAGGLQSEMRDLRQRIAREVGDAPAERPEQCRVYLLGASACGGPQSYLIYSTGRSDERRIHELARQYKEAEEKYNRVSGTLGTCSHTAPPEVRLENGRCMARRK